MIRFLLLFSLLALTCRAAAQDLSLCRQVVGSTGTSAVEQGLLYQYTVGEVAVFTIRSNQADFTLTQGFHQSDVCLPTSSVDDPTFADWQIQVYPNPVADWLTVRWVAPQGQGLQVAIVNQLGQVVRPRYTVSDDDIHLIDCGALPAGLYFLQLHDPVSRAVSTVRFVRL
jgi:hypothetical protein